MESGVFFKFLKQHLRVKSFWGNSENAVRVQIYVAIITYCLVAIIESVLKLNRDIYEVMRTLVVLYLWKTISRIYLAMLNTTFFIKMTVSWNWILHHNEPYWDVLHFLRDTSASIFLIWRNLSHLTNILSGYWLVKIHFWLRKEK